MLIYYELRLMRMRALRARRGFGANLCSNEPISGKDFQVIASNLPANFREELFKNNSSLKLALKVKAMTLKSFAEIGQESRCYDLRFLP